MNIQELKELQDRLRAGYDQLKVNPLDFNTLFTFIGYLTHTVDNILQEKINELDSTK